MLNFNTLSLRQNVSLDKIKKNEEQDHVRFGGRSDRSRSGIKGKGKKTKCFF